MPSELAIHLLVCSTALSKFTHGKGQLPNPWNTRSLPSHTLKVTQTEANGPWVLKVQVWRKKLEHLKTELLHAQLFLPAGEAGLTKDELFLSPGTVSLPRKVFPSLLLSQLRFYHEYPNELDVWPPLECTSSAQSQTGNCVMSVKLKWCFRPALACWAAKGALPCRNPAFKIYS